MFCLGYVFEGEFSLFLSFVTFRDQREAGKPPQTLALLWLQLNPIKRRKHFLHMNLRPLAVAAFLRTHFSSENLIQRADGVRLWSAFSLAFSRIWSTEARTTIKSDSSWRLMWPRWPRPVESVSSSLFLNKNDIQDRREQEIINDWFQAFPLLLWHDANQTKQQQKCSTFQQDITTAQFTLLVLLRLTKWGQTLALCSCVAAVLTRAYYRWRKLNKLNVSAIFRGMQRSFFISACWCTHTQTIT